MSSPDAPPTKNPVPRSLRVITFFLSTALMFLLIWLLGFILRDIGNIDGPNYQEILDKHVDGELRSRASELQKEIAETETKIARQGERQQTLKRSMDNARETMQQMMDLQRLSLEREATPTDEERDALAIAQKRFLDAQNSYEEANTEIAQSNEKRFELTQERKSVQDRISAQEEPAREEFDGLVRKHQFKVASLKLAFILPLFAAAAWMFYRRSRSPYRMILLACLFATGWKVGVVMFDYFPRDFFKYIAIVAAILIVLAFLVWLLRKAARPNLDLLLKQYREAYRSHRCPVCTYPIVRGPLRFAFWTRKGPQLNAGTGAASGGIDDDGEETPYSCPSCGTNLFEPCSECGKSRHALLPFCEHCGAERSAEPAADAEAAVSAS